MFILCFKIMFLFSLHLFSSCSHGVHISANSIFFFFFLAKMFPIARKMIMLQPHSTLPLVVTSTSIVGGYYSCPLVCPRVTSSSQELIHRTFGRHSCYSNVTYLEGLSNFFTLSLSLSDVYSKSFSTSGKQIKC